MCITPRGPTTSKMSVFVFSNLLRLSTTFYQKTSEVKILRHHREKNYKISDQNSHLASYQLRGVMHTAELDSAEGSTRQSLTPRCASHHGVFSDTLFSWLRRMRHTARSFLKIWISRRNWKWIRKYFSLFIRGLDGLESGKNRDRKSCNTLPLRPPSLT